MSAFAAGASEPGKDYAESVVNDVHTAIQVEMDVIEEARKRRKFVKGAASTFKGVLRTFNSGSIAHGTAKNPLPDADAGVVLDRRAFPDLGPDSPNRGGPAEVVEAMAKHVMSKIKPEYPNATCKLTKRAIEISFHSPVDDEDPSVDLIVALTRKDADGLWIPNTKKNDWDASDPEEHTRLLTKVGDQSLRTLRARIIRLVKVALGQDKTPVIISFNVEALAVEHVTKVTRLAEGLRDFLWAAADDIATRLTPDPAGISPAIKLPEGVTQEQASRRLRFFGNKVGEAIEFADDEQCVLEALVELFPEQLPDAPRSSRSGLADALRRGNRSPKVQSVLGTGADGLRNTRAYGDAAR